MNDGHALVGLLLAPDKDGNIAALARRMGVQGIIFNCQAWFGSGDGEMGNYSYCYGKNGKRKKNLDPTQAHMNHVHIELNMRGAKKLTTFWNKTITYDAPAPLPVQQPQPQPQPQKPWTGQGGGTQFDQTGGSWN
jgi:hypothetical protein